LRFTNAVAFSGNADFLTINGTTISSSSSLGELIFEEQRFAINNDSVWDWANNDFRLFVPLVFENSQDAATTRTNLGLGATNAVTFSNITASGTLAVSNTATFSTNVSVGGTFAATGNATLNGVGNTAPSQTASSGSSLMTRDLSDARYGGPVVFSKLTNNVSYTNDTTGTTILTVTFPAAGAYEVTQLVRFTAGGANSKVSLAGSSAGTAFSGYRESYNNGSSPTRVVGLKNPVGTGGSFGDTVNADNHGRHGVIIAYSGATLEIAAAQNTNSTNVTTVGSGSYLSVRRLSADSAW